MKQRTRGAGSFKPSAFCFLPDMLLFNHQNPAPAPLNFNSKLSNNRTTFRNRNITRSYSGSLASLSFERNADVSISTCLRSKRLVTPQANVISHLDQIKRHQSAAGHSLSIRRHPSSDKEISIRLKKLEKRIQMGVALVQGLKLHRFQHLHKNRLSDLPILEKCPQTAKNRLSRSGSETGKMRTNVRKQRQRFSADKNQSPATDH